MEPAAPREAFGRQRRHRESRPAEYPVQGPSSAKGRAGSGGIVRRARPVSETGEEWVKVSLKISVRDYSLKQFEQTLFSHPTAHYDFLVVLDATKAPRYSQNLAVEPAVTQRGRYANAVTTREDNLPPLMPGFDPVQMLYDDLEVRYNCVSA